MEIKNQKILDSILAVEDARKEAIRLEEYERNKITPEKIDAKISELRNMNWDFYRGSVENLMKEVIFFQDNCNYAFLSNESADPSLTPKIKEYDRFFKNLQKQEFPKMRAEYARISKNILWEHNIDVKQSGTSITFIGGIFANNANKKEFQDKIHDAVSDLRFKRVNYKWYKYDDEYTYYTISSPQDDELR